MTNNQISFLNYREANRANLARENETNRANLARENEAYRSNLANETEARRANLARERETNRANLAKEYETNRANVVHEQIDIGKLHETVRMNDETMKHNRITESISSRQNELTAERNSIEQYIAELKNAMESNRLSFDQQREAQRVVESLRDYQLAVGKLLMSGATPSIFRGFNAARNAAAAAISGGIGAAAGAAASNSTPKLPGGKSNPFLSILNKVSKAPLLLWFKHLGDLVQPVRPGGKVHYTQENIV